VDSTSRVLALAVATSFAAGLNTYATVATLGVLARTGVVDLPASLEIVASWPVIGAAAALYLVEFVADKIPAVDLAWNVLHTFVRVPAAALIAYAATAQLTPTDQLIAAAVGSLVALAAHGGKTAARVAVTPSPEPFSNIALSLGEDAVAVSLTWLASRHPIAAAAIALAFVAAIVASIRFVVRAIRRAMHEPRPARA
jgi:Domain of unknown function (DUF4126)